MSLSPYQFKILRLVGGAISIISLIKIYTALKGLSHPVLLFGLAAVGLAGLAAYILFYFFQMSETDKLIGIYMPVRELGRLKFSHTISII